MEESVSAETRLLKSFELASKVAQAVGYERLAPEAKAKSPAEKSSEAIKALQSGLSVKNPKDSQVLIISFRSRDPNLPRIVMEELVRRYLELNIALRHASPDADPVAAVAAALDTSKHPDISVIEQPAAARVASR
jgi:uncharacterized protein involved in exopolysaccharide biosynthesis